MFALPRCPKVNDAGKAHLPDLPRLPLGGGLSLHLSAEPVMTLELFKAFVLGVVEGLTEFLPVSSTGHLLLVQRFFGFDDEDFGKTFAVLIQFGAILALLSIYFVRLWHIALGMFSDPAARRFVIGVLIAFLPAAVVGALGARFHQVGIVQPLDRLLHPHRRRRRSAVGRSNGPQATLPRRHAVFAADVFRHRRLAQCVSMIPGVSRAGATIVSAMLLGADRRSAAEFSFWLAMPTMAGAFAYDLYKSRGQMSMDNAILVAFGFVGVVRVRAGSW